MKWAFVIALLATLVALWIWPVVAEKLPPPPGTGPK